MRPFHLPVLLQETLERLAPSPGKVFVDCTLGGGGHTQALLAAGASVVALDRDPEAIDFVREKVTECGERLKLAEADFRYLKTILNGFGIEKVDGILADIGVSSWQIDTAGRGFSFRLDGPLDMRMSPHAGETAADLVNTLPQEGLERIFREFGEEHSARKIARELVKARVATEFRTTLQLAEAVERIVPRHGPRHSATQIFQALRIAVNGELDALQCLLDTAPELLTEGGKIAIITFHSLEDRIVKQFFRETSREFDDRPEWTAPRPNSRCFFKRVPSKAVIASELEIASNPRARSAKLRVAERRGHVA